MLSLILFFPKINSSSLFNACNQGSGDGYGSEELYFEKVAVLRSLAQCKGEICREEGDPSHCVYAL